MTDHEDHEEHVPDCEECEQARFEAMVEERDEIAYWENENPGWARELKNRR